MTIQPWGILNFHFPPLGDVDDFGMIDTLL